MPDPRFFPAPAPQALSEIASLSGAEPGASSDPDLTITGIAPLSEAGPSDISFLAGRKNLGQLEGSRAGAVFVTADLADRVQGPAVLIHGNPQAAYVMLARRLYPDPVPEPGIHPAAHVDAGAHLAEGCRVEPGAVIEAGAEIGAGGWIGPNAVIGRNVRIGAGARIGPGVIVSHAEIGARVILHPGAAIGQDGFSYIPGEAGLVKIPQLGRVLIGDDVEIGANTTIDRGAGQDTVIGQGTKIDNLVQIGHNCRIGRFCIIVSQVGMAGSATLGDFVQLGGKVGISDHVTIGQGAKIAAGSGVMRDVPPGEVHAGSPAQPVADWHRETVILKRLRERKE